MLDAWYVNGYPAELDEPGHMVIGDVLANPLPEGTNTWAEHRHAAADVARFLDWFVRLNDK